MKFIKIATLTFIALASTSTQTESLTYGCNPVMPSRIDARPGEVVVVNAQIDCFFLAGLGSTFGPTEAINIDLNANDIQKTILSGEHTNVSQLTKFPSQGNLFAFSYAPTSGRLKGMPIEVVIRSEPITKQFKDILQKQLKTAQDQKDAKKLSIISNILNDIDNKSLVRFYRRLRAIGETKFKPLHDMIFTTPAEQNVADIVLRPNGNLQVYDRSGDKVLLTEEPFGEM